jgi:hypothetical protein
LGPELEEESWPGKNFFIPKKNIIKKLFQPFFTKVSFLVEEKILFFQSVKTVFSGKMT